MVTSQSSNAARSVPPASPVKVISYVRDGIRSAPRVRRFLRAQPPGWLSHVSSPLRGDPQQAATPRGRNHPSNEFAANAHYVIGDLRTWGWITLIFGVLQLLAAYLVLRGNQVA